MQITHYIKKGLLLLLGLVVYTTGFSYNIDSLITAIGPLSFEEQHKKVEKEMTRLRDRSVQDAVELGNYWINLLNEKQESKKAADFIVLTANAYYLLGNYTLNLQYLQTALQLYKALKDQKGEAIATREMGFTYRKMGENEDAYRALELSIRYLEAIQEYNELATTYNYMGNLIEEWKKDYTLAEKLYRKSIANAEKMNNRESISYSLEFIGIVKSELGEKDSSIYYLNQSLEIRKELGLPMAMAISYTNLAEVLDKNGDYRAAHKYYNQALQISSAIKFNDLTNFLYGNLSKIHQKKGNLDSAINFLELQQAMKDSIFNLQKTKEFADIKEKYASEIKEEKIIALNNRIELEHQKSQKNIYLFTAIIAVMGGFVLMAVIIGIIIYNREQKKIAKEKIDQERLRNKMIIEAEEKERTRIAKDLHDSLGQMLAALKMNLNSIPVDNQGNDQYKKTALILDETIVEMRSISHAMMPESLVKNGLAKALIDITNHIETNQTQVNIHVENWKGWNSTGEYILYRIVQELLNNTLKHANASRVNIELNQFEDEINLIYEDDGQGFDPESASSDGIGLKNMYNRMSSLNGHIEFDSKPGKGTTVILSIPLKN
jgi:two-component system NarL family sensor kinase